MSGGSAAEAGWAPLGDGDWPEEVADLRDGFAGRLDVYRVMARHPALLQALGRRCGNMSCSTPRWGRSGAKS
jgi:hypothetical protein